MSLACLFVTRAQTRVSKQSPSPNYTYMTNPQDSDAKNWFENTHTHIITIDKNRQAVCLGVSQSQSPAFIEPHLNISENEITTQKQKQINGKLL